MNALDIGIIIILGAFVWLGSTQRPARQASMSAGAIAGLLLGSLIYTKLAFLATGSVVRTAILGLMIITLGLLCYDIFITAGKFAESKLHHRFKLSRLQRRITSSSIAGLTGVVIIWLTIGIFSTLATPVIQRSVYHSTLISATRHVVRLPTPFSAPQTFTNAEPTFTSRVAVSDSFASLDAAVANASSSVFKVQSWGCGTTTIGSSFMVSKQAVITNAHVIAGATRISVQDRRNTASYVAQVILFDPALDIAILSTSAQLPSTPLKLNAAPATVSTIGSVLGYPDGKQFSDSDAIIIDALDAKGYDIYNRDTVSRAIYALRGDIVPGNSGGPLINANGEVLGLVFGHSTSQNHTGYAITAKQIAPSIATALKRNTTTSSGSCTK